MSILKYFRKQNYFLSQPEDIPGVATSTVHAAIITLLKNCYKERGTLTIATKLSWTLAGMLSYMEIQQLLESIVNN